MHLQKRELIWKGKYDADGQVAHSLIPDPPLELVKRESFNSSELLDSDTFRSMLLHGDNKLVISSLLSEFKGAIDLIYIDPPFDVGMRFDMNISLGDESDERDANPVNLTTPAYDDRWGSGIDSYLQSLVERLTLMHKLLADSGSIYVHCDWRANSYIRLIMDSIFGTENFLNEIVWLYGLGGSSNRYWSRKHDSILFYSKTVNGHYFNPEMVPTTSRRMKGKNKKCPDYWEIPSTDGTSDYWDIPSINNQALERTGYSTQKPEQLLERIIAASSRKGNLIADFYCGSGTAGAVAEKLGRRWIMSDSGKMAIHTARKRMINIQQNSKSGFDLYDFGSVDREWTQTRKLGITEERFRSIVLKRFNADLLNTNDLTSPLIHGIKEDRYCHISPIMGKMNSKRLRQVADAVKNSDCRSCYCLAYDFDWDLQRNVNEINRNHGTELIPVKIPSDITEQRSGKSLMWFGLSGIDLQVEISENSVDITLTGFLPNLIAASDKKLSEYRAVASNNSFDLIDFWSVDFNYKTDQPFKHHWSAYRTRSERSLSLSTDIKFRHPAGGDYTICVMVVDVFGNESYGRIEVNS